MVSPSRSMADAPPHVFKSPADFNFSDVTASRYKEFEVVKVNKRGVRQARSSMACAWHRIHAPSRSRVVIPSAHVLCAVRCQARVLGIDRQREAQLESRGGNADALHLEGGDSGPFQAF